MLAAGFIGQFGKRLADYLLARSRRRRERKRSAAAAAVEIREARVGGPSGVAREFPRLPGLQSGAPESPSGVPDALGGPSEVSGGASQVSDESLEVPDRGPESQAADELDGAAMAKIIKKLSKAEVKRIKKEGS